MERKKRNVPTPDQSEGGQEPKKRPPQARFLREVYEAENNVPEGISVRNWNVTVSYWASDTSTYQAVGEKYGFSGTRARGIVISTMSKLYHTTSPEIQDKYLLDILLKSKRSEAR